MRGRAGERGFRFACLERRDAVSTRRDAREAEGAPLLREYRVKSSIEGSNPSHSARKLSKPAQCGLFLCLENLKNQ